MHRKRENHFLVDGSLYRSKTLSLSFASDLIEFLKAPSRAPQEGPKTRKSRNFEILSDCGRRDGSAGPARPSGVAWGTPTRVAGVPLDSKM